MPTETGYGTLTIICLLLLLGATGKSAQIPLYVWLPDAMAGPTPVSALIHAATMVTAGVYMTARSAAFFTHAPIAMDWVATSAWRPHLVAATIGLAQTDIKKVFAYSTVSQLGYMFVGLGVGAFSAGIFHLMTHAFFKALLFLGAGCGDPRIAWRAGFASDGRTVQAHADYGHHITLCFVCHLRLSLHLRIFQQGRDSGGGLRPCAVDVLGGRHHRRDDRLLRLSRLVSGIHGRVSRPGASP